MSNPATDAQRPPGPETSLPVFVAGLDAHGRIEFASQTACEWFDTGAAPLVGMPLAKLVGDDLWRALEGSLDLALGGGTATRDLEVAALGMRRHARFSLMPRIGADGIGSGALLVINDMTAIRQSEAAARETAAIFEGAFESAAAGIGVMSLDGHWLRANPALCRMVGYSEAELRTMRFHDITHPDDLEQDVAGTRRLIAGEQSSLALDKRYIHKDGSVVHIHLTVAAVRDAAGHLSHTISQITDITRRHHAEAALRDSEIQFRAISEASPLGIFVDDTATQCTYVNPAYERITGLTREQALRHGWMRAIHPDDKPLIESRVLDRTGRVDSQALEHRYLHADGKVVVARIKVAAMRDGERLLGFVGVVEDVTEQRRAEQEILRLNAELEGRVLERTGALSASMRDLESFSYSVSHDLRAPLRALDGYSALLLEKDKLDDDGRAMLRTMRSTAQRMAQLIDDLLSLAQVGRRQLQRRRVDLAAIARSIGGELAAGRSRRPGRFVAPETLPVSADPQLVRVLLQNLLENAWKFSATRDLPSIEFGVDHEDGRPVYYVRDNGVGFDPAYAQKLFLPFQRLHRADEFPGNGVGLASARRTVEHHGGDLWAESAPGTGATFKFTLGNDALPG